MSQIPEGCPMFEGPCATTELAASIDGPVGGECGCGWAWGTYLTEDEIQAWEARRAAPDMHPTTRDLNTMEGP
ncbi:MAG TPA: hypothetical protein VLL08_33335 [Kineosporiaceae bacterium]|nr:hypothetical protein [Kineosporiaceae bacterium]